MEGAVGNPDEGVTRVGPDRWFSVHVYDQEGVRGALLEVVLPATRQLYQEGGIDSFFFVRYKDDRGHHVRLRLCLRKAAAHTCLERILALAGERFPVTCSSYELETERYGGDGALPHSLSFFAVSSTHALAFEREFGHLSRSRQITLTLCFLLWQAWGFAGDKDELMNLISYYELGVTKYPEMVKLAEETFRRSGKGLTELIGQELQRLIALDEEGGELVSLASAGSLVAASRALSTAVGDLEPEARWSVGSSQMHMTANRLGLTNPQETYASQILCHAMSEIAASDPTLWRQVVDGLGRRAGTGGGPAARADALQGSVRDHLAALLPQPA